ELRADVLPIYNKTSFRVGVKFNVHNIGATTANNVTRKIDHEALDRGTHIPCILFDPADNITIPRDDIRPEKQIPGEWITVDGMREVIAGTKGYDVLVRYAWLDIYGRPHHAALGLVYNADGGRTFEIYHPICK